MIDNNFLRCTVRQRPIICAHLCRSLQSIYFPGIFLMALFSSVHYCRVAYIQAMAWSGWSVGEWLTNFEAGWVRRGLGGQMILWASDTTHIQMNWIVLIIQVASYLCFVTLFLKLLRQKNISFWYFVACFSPGFLLFTYYDSMAVGRKEVLLYLMFVVWLHICLRHQNNLRNTILFSVAYCVLTLIHETFFFYSPYFVAIVMLCEGQKLIKIRTALLIPISSLIGVTAIIMLASPMDGPRICDSLTSRGIPSVVCSGPINFGVPSSDVLLKNYFSNFDLMAFVSIVLVFGIVLLPAHLVLRDIHSLQKIEENWLGVLIIIILFSAPLFILATDWGRWISMHCTLSILLFLAALPDRSKIQAKQLMRVRFLASKHLLSVLLSGVLLFLFVGSYSLKHCCEKNFITVFGPIKKILSNQLFSNKSSTPN
jgi:hypothetical protein